MNLLLHALIQAYVLTSLLEAGVYLILFRKNPGQVLLYSALINGLTNPLLNYVYLFHYPVLLPLEGVTVLIESFLIRSLFRTGWKPAAFCSVCANCASLFVGKLLLS